MEPRMAIVNVESVGPLAKVHGDDRMPRHTRIRPARGLSITSRDPSKAVRHGRTRPIWIGGMRLSPRMSSPERMNAIVKRN